MVLLVLDEFPVTSLLDGHGRVDAVRYPHFAALAGQATWYRDAASVHADTTYAVPAILAGRMPRPGHVPVVRDYRESLFELLAGRYRFHVREEATQLCPVRYCVDRGPLLLGKGPSEPRRNVKLFLRAGKRDVTSGPGRRNLLLTHLDQARPQRFRSWVAGIGPGRAPQLDFMHFMLPHMAWYLLPSGLSYNLPGGQDLRGLTGHRSFDDHFLVRQAWQRHLLQVGATDELLGELMTRLQQTGLWDRSLVIVTADHGISFQRGRNRRKLRPGNVGELAPVPLFVKAPGQARGRISDAPRQTIDVLPTIAHYAGVHIPWKVDGRSLVARPGRRTRRMLSTKFHGFAVDRPEFRRQRRDALRRQLGLFGWGRRGPGLYGIGPLRGLVGRRLSSFRVKRSRGAHLQLRGARFFRSVWSGYGFLPAQVSGIVKGGRRGGGRPLVVALNGRIVATGYTFSLTGGRREYASVMVPEDRFRTGRNRLAVLERAPDGRLILLARA